MLSPNHRVFLTHLPHSDDEFLPQVAKINDVEKNVAELEQTVLMLDDFTKRLEEKFRKVAAQRREAARIAKAAEES